MIHEHRRRCCRRAKRSAEDDGSQDVVRSAFVSDGVPARLDTKKRQAENEGDQDEHKIMKADTP